ncbi:MAG TPA: sigma-70 family RNA polymerase sigma factor, partial [Aeromicrobium sp.]|nr:sigma-70 family RNA polymerase sigma factor [Aeromicrobium sp.]
MGEDVARFERSRPRLEAIAYRLLGSADEAQDVVQETFLRWHAADVERIEVPEAWLTKVLTNLCLNLLSSARARRETYVGRWLPEPLLTGDPMLGPAESVDQQEAVSYAVLTLMERLSPNERAVYVLREAFHYSHGEIAEILDITEAASQQIFHRAKQRVASGKARPHIDTTDARRIVEEFLAAATSGQTDELVRLLTKDAIAVGDGGGKVPARTKPFEGAVAVAKFMSSLFTPAAAKHAIVGGSPE